jgi:sulfur-oxidizing protein SoxA
LKAFALALLCAFPGAALADDARRSGYDYMQAETRAMQDDDMSNPGTLWVLDGEALWKRKSGTSGRACADCHGAMTGVAARYPKLDAKRGKPVDLEQRINFCRVERQGAPALAWESRDLLALSAYIGMQSRGLPIAADEASRPFAEKGRELFFRRQGQINLSCAQCHDQNAGRHLGGSVIPQGHPTGYPLYRLEWEGLASLQRRLRNCIANVRATPYPYGSEELVDLELYLMRRAGGMKIETPAVRP